jgi:hypothetical protein
MAQAETEKLTQMVFGAGLSRAISTIAELGVADQIEPGSPQPIESLARVTGAHERTHREQRRTSFMMLSRQSKIG